MWKMLTSLFGGGEKSEYELAMERTGSDGLDPRKRFVFCVLAVSNDVDPAYMVERSKTAVGEWYGIHSASKLEERITGYLEVGFSTPAYDAFRAAFLARAGLAAGLLSEGASWDAAFKAGRKVQASYASFRDYGMGYVEGHLDYRKNQGDPVARLAEIRQSKLSHMGDLVKDVWKLSFTTPL